MEDIMEVSESKIRMTTVQSISKEKITRKKYLDSILSSIQENRKRFMIIARISLKEYSRDSMLPLLPMGKLEPERLIQYSEVKAYNLATFTLL